MVVARFFFKEMAAFFPRVTGILPSHQKSKNNSIFLHPNQCLVLLVTIPCCGFDLHFSND